MAFKFDACPDSSPHSAPNQPAPGEDATVYPTDAMNSLKRDRFELLSAYLDGEVTAEERRQVESWLRHDPSVQQLYNRLLKLRQGMQTLSIPSPEPVEQTVAQVITRVDRQPRSWLTWGGVAIAATFLVFLSDLGYSPSSRLQPVADVPVSSDSEVLNPALVESEALMIALDQPIIEIPKAVVSEPLPLAQ